MKRLSGVERKKAIVEAAVRLFSEKGFRGTTTRELARSAGISEALLFQHFPSKKKLYQAIFEHKMAERLPSLFEGMEPKGPPVSVLTGLALRIARQNEADPSLMRLLLYSALEGHGLSDLFFSRRTLPLMEFLKKYFSAHQEHFKKIDPELAARIFLAMVFGYLQTRILFRIPQVFKTPLKKSVQTLASIFVGGMTP